MRTINLDTHVRDESERYDCFFHKEPEKKTENGSDFFIINLSLKAPVKTGDRIILRFCEYEVTEIIEERSSKGKLGERKYTYQRVKTTFVS